jgi:hypothetical protein
VKMFITPISPCPLCGRQRMDLPGPHAPHWVVRGDGRSVLVDCVGRPLAVAS